MLYYSVAKLWSITGRSEFVYRLVMLILHFFGALALFKVLEGVLRSGTVAALLALLFLSSPTVVYFAIGFLPEVPALDLCLMGCWALLVHHRSARQRVLVVAIILLTLAALLKVTAAMCMLALLAVCVAELLFPRAARRRGPLFQNPARMILLLVVGCGVVWLWYAYTDRYNVEYRGSFSNQVVQAAWTLEDKEFDRAWTFGKTLLPGLIHHWSVWTLVLLAFVHVLVRMRKMPLWVFTMNLALCMGTILYILLWFVALNEHDYYFILPLVTPWALLVTSVWLLLRDRPRLTKSPTAIGLLCILVGVNVWYAREDHLMRTRGIGSMESQGTYPLHSRSSLQYWERAQYWTRSGTLDIEPYARSIGITEQDTVICVPDHSVCASLYLCGQRGWQNFGTLNDLEDSLSMETYKARGARYLYVLETAWLERPYMSHFTTRPIGEHRGLKIYDLRSF